MVSAGLVVLAGVFVCLALALTIWVVACLDIASQVRRRRRLAQADTHTQTQISEARVSEVPEAQERFVVDVAEVLPEVLLE